MSKGLAEKVDPRFLREEGLEVFTGCELLVKGLLEVEGGTHLWTGYPGSPVAGFFDCIELIQEIPKQHGIHASLANNEAVAVAMVNGSQMLGLRAFATMKSVGVHVASDALALGNLAGAHREGGAIIGFGDDPWSDSTQVAADSRFLAKHLFMPVMEPSDPQELKDWINLAFRLSRASGFYIGYLIPTNQADGGGSVRVRRNQWPEINTRNPAEINTAAIQVEQTVLLPPRTGVKEDQLESRRQQLWQEAARLGTDRIDHPNPGAPFGFITSGETYCYLQHALTEMGLEGRFPILKLGITYPVDPHVIEQFARHVRQIIVVEERRGFLEEQVVHILNAGPRISDTPVWGKQLPGGGSIPATRGLNPSLLIERLAPVLLQFGGVEKSGTIERELELIRETASYDISLPNRSPTFCPGCPHRDSASVLIEIKRHFRNPDYMRRRHGKDAVDLVFHGDTGCYTMLMFEPNKDLMHNYSGMGLGGGTGAGIDPFIRNKQVVFMGDSTFFHSGQIAISNSIKGGQDITYVILDNKTTAMTGQQTTPGQEVDLVGNPQFKQSIDDIIQAMMRAGHAKVVRVNPSYRQSYQALLERTILSDGVKVVVADKECGITSHRRQLRNERQEVRLKGFVSKKRHINITPEVCENCRECTKSTGCPGLTLIDTPHGTKVQTDWSRCVADGACAKIKVCPSFEEVTVVRKTAPPSRLASLSLDNLPEPARKVSFSEAWHVYLAGVGGMGIGISTATLVRAGFREGYRVLFCDRKGLAIRNGGVYSQVSFFRNGQRVSNLIPYGKADLILGIDILEAVRGLDPRSNQRIGSAKYTAAVVNTAKLPTIPSLMGLEDFSTAALEKTLQFYTDHSRYLGFDVSKLSEKYLDTNLFANIVLLGAAYQQGLLPLRLENLLWAIQHSTGPAAKQNVAAFQLGRAAVIDPSLRPDERSPLRYAKLVDRKCRHFERHHPARDRVADAYRRLMEHAERTINLPERYFCDLAIHISDLIWYENATYAKRYLDLVKTVFSRDTAEHDFLATRTVIANLARAMIIKDEVYVAHLLTSEEKLERDRERYDVDPARGDRIRYVHLTRPTIPLGSKNLQFDLRTYNWQLNLVKRMRFLRRFTVRWHRAEMDFRDWYLDLVPRFQYTTPAEYQTWLQILRSPEEVRGYRTVRHPRQEEVRKAAEEALERLPASSDARLKDARLPF
jgi:indolepyruvate ferredoxin oxidoreductase